MRVLGGGVSGINPSMGLSTSAAVQLGNAMVSRLGPYKNSLFRLTMEKIGIYASIPFGV